MEVLLFAIFFIASLTFFISGKDDFGRQEKKLLIKDNEKEEVNDEIKREQKEKVEKEVELEST